MPGHLKLLHALIPEPFIIRSIDFLDWGSSLLVCYLESHRVYVLLSLNFDILLTVQIASVRRSNLGPRNGPSYSL